MPVGNFNNKQTTYYNFSKPIEHRVFVVTGKKEALKQYHYIEGFITKISKKEDEYNGKPIEKLEIHLTNKSNNIIDVISCNYNSAVAQDILNSLANIDNFGYIRLTPYVSVNDKTKEEYKHCAVRNNGIAIKRKYYDEVPKTEYVKVGKNEVPNSEKRDEFFDNLFNEAVAKIKFVANPETTIEPDFDDEDDDGDVPF